VAESSTADATSIEYDGITMNNLLLGVAGCVLALGSGHVGQGSDDLLPSVTYVVQTPLEKSAKLKRVGLFADRSTYWDDDPVGQFLLSFQGQAWQGRHVNLELVDEQGFQFRKTIGPMTQPKAALLVRVGLLKPGNYRLTAKLEQTAATAETRFTRLKQTNPPAQFPAAGIELEVEKQEHVSSARWPIQMGIPFPPGALHDVAELGLFENGTEIPANFTKINTWHPEAPGIVSSVRWARVQFSAKYFDGAPARYLVKKTPRHQFRRKDALHIWDAGDWFTVDTGPIRFRVNRKNFRGIETAWRDLNGDGNLTDDELILSTSPVNAKAPVGLDPSGPYLTDGRSTSFEAARDATALVRLEESGPERVSICAEGWYVNPTLSAQAGQRLCKFQTRILAFAGQPFLRIQHRTILTYDTNTNRLGDVGFRLSVPNWISWQLGADGAVLDGKAPTKGKSIFLHQNRWDRFRLVGAKEKEIVGARSNGWFTAKTASGRAAVTLCVPDLWRKFPQEVEFTPEGLVYHQWPAHGMLSFTPQEMYDRAQIYKLRYLHEGRLMDLRFPSLAYDFLKDLDRTQPWDPEHTSEMAINGNGQGIAVADEFTLLFHGANEPAASFADLAEHDPHARSSPEWNASSTVEGNLSALDAKRFPEAEANLSSYFPDYQKVIVDGTAEYGRWIHADVHNHWEVSQGRANLHRVWQASHYRHVWTPWLIYFRGGPFAILRWARANSDHFMDIDTVQYEDPAFPLKGHIAGAEFHCKGFSPWGSSSYGQRIADAYLGNWGHWINPCAYLIRYLIEGDRRAHDLYRLWGTSLTRVPLPSAPGREIANTLAEIVDYYRFTWDPDAIVWINDMANALLASKLESWPNPGSFPLFNLFWFSKLYELKRDPRVLDRFLGYCDTYGANNPMLLAWAYEQTGNQRFLKPQVSGELLNQSRAVYRCPGDPLDGYRYTFASTGIWHVQSLPYWLHALSKAGIQQLSEQGGPEGYYPTRASHPIVSRGEIPAQELLVYVPEGKPIRLEMESMAGIDVYAPLIRLIDRMGLTEFRYQAPRPKSLRYINADKLILTIPAPKESGLKRIDFRSWQGIYFRPPFTDAPAEGVLLMGNADYKLLGPQDMYFEPVDPGTDLTMYWRGAVTQSRSAPVYVHVEDATGKELLTTTVLAGSRRAEVSLEARPDRPFPWRVVSYCPLEATWGWKGASGTLLGANSRPVLEKLIAEWKKQPPAPQKN
jgi:hypothetical protein